jgi:aminoglycoside phosphotransferase (APT) family kinase protein
MSGAEAFTGVKPVEARHRIDEARLAEWMASQVKGFSGPLTVMRFKGGQSNPTYRLETPGQAYVLRRKPFGTLLPSAHAVEREFRVTGALYAEDFPVPRPFALCEDSDVIGAAFYVMEAVDGAVHWDGSLPGLDPHGRHRHYAAMIGTLARLHGIDPESAGLSDFGKAGNYFARQIDRWTRQYRAAEDGRIEDVEHLIDWLPRTVPEQEGTAIVHGDYRLDNLIYRPDGTVAAVLDWELSTLGDPLADFSYLLMQWELPADGRSPLGGLDLPALGIPTRDEAVAIYCRASGRPGIPKLDWYFAYNLFRLVGILQGVAGRAKAGNAASEHAAAMAARVPRLAAAAWRFAKAAGA